IDDLAGRYINHFYLDLEKLNIEPPDIFPRVTEHIAEITAMVEELINQGAAYEKEGSVYFDVSSFKNYGRLSGVKLAEAKTGTRVAADKHEKEEAADFALWNAAGEGEEEVGAVWDSPWGKGRPGWHIECSVMSRVHLGETLDIHGGARDLRFPHHENELAQSESATGKKFTNYWVHAGLVTVEGRKMSRSASNFTAFDDLVQKEFNPLAFRYLCMTAHYRGELNFTWAGLEAAQSALDRLYTAVAEWDEPGKIGCAEYEKEFDKLIHDDLNLPDTLALLWRLVKDQELPTSGKMTTLLRMDRILGLNLGAVERIDIPAQVRELAAERERQRKQGNWVGSDEIRDQIEQLGYRVEDTEDGPAVKRVRE
ncbi:MAG: cysteine--tRNA ligase, partial [bacterium]|nr:cysteine--tRNA ligase [bacterium]